MLYAKEITAQTYCTNINKINQHFGKFYITIRVCAFLNTLCVYIISFAYSITIAQEIFW